MIKTRILNWLSVMIGAVITLLGFNSCDDKECMYGTPYANFSIKGKVVDAQNNPVEGAKVSVEEKISGSDNEGKWKPLYANDNVNEAYVLTDAEGNYSFTATTMEKTLLVIVTPPEGSGLQPDEEMLTVTYTNGDNNWNMGSYSGTLDFQLVEKK